MTEPLSPDEVNEIIVNGDVSRSSPHYLPIKTKTLTIVPPTPEQSVAILDLLSFYETPWWRRVLRALLRREK